MFASEQKAVTMPTAPTCEFLVWLDSGADEK